MLENPEFDGPTLEIDSLTVGYGGEPAVADVSIQVQSREFVAVLGANGAGKTTLLRAICSLVKPSAGMVRLRGRDVTDAPAHSLVGLGLAMVPEGRQLFGSLSVEDNLRLGWFSQRRAARAWRDRLDQATAMFPELRDRLGTTSAALSGGQQQMVAIARALMSDPALLILDEPSLGLAPLVCDRIFNVLRDLQAEGRSVLLVEQNARLSLEISERAYVLERGRVVRDGPSAELLNDPSIQEHYLGVSGHNEKPCPATDDAAPTQ